MKAGIVTITNGYNYGNRLQNYAVQEALESVGILQKLFGKRQMFLIQKILFICVNCISKGFYIII